MEALTVEFDAPAKAPPMPSNGSAVAIRSDIAPDNLPVDVPTMTPMAMLSHAIERGANIDVLEKLMALQERWEANQARKAFDAAMAAAKAEFPAIVKDRTVSYENKGGNSTNYKHEDLAGISKAIDPILSKYGLSYRFRVSSENGQPIKVTCVIAHRLGYSEETTLSAGADSSGGKNSIQAIGSTVTYLQRYTLKAALGLAAAVDNDGKNADEKLPAPTSNGSQLITAAQVAELEALAKEVGVDVARFCKYGQIRSLADIAVEHFPKAKQTLLLKRTAGVAR